MIMLDLATDTAGPILSSSSSTKEDGDPEAFERLLKGLSLSLEQGKSISTKGLALLLANEDQTPQTDVISAKTEASTEKQKTTSIITLLRDEENEQLPSDNQHDSTLLNAKITTDLPSRQINELIEKAKVYLKDEINRIADVKEMPKTLKGLVLLANKFGIDLSKITLDQAQEKTISAEAKTVFRTATTDKTTPLLQTNTRSDESRTGLNTIPTAELIQKSQPLEPKAQMKPEPLQTLLQKEASSAASKHVSAHEAPAPLKDAPAAAAKAEQLIQQTVARAETSVVPADKKSEPKSKKETAETRTATVQTAAGKSVSQNITPMQSAVVTEENALSATASKQPLFSSALNELIHSETRDSEAVQENTHKAVDTISRSAPSLSSVAAADPLEIKINEAKQTMRHFAGDIKEAIENYKPPFTRLKIQLHPVKLGEVDVTMIQRGNNLHININSNTTAITTLSQNATELRSQLSQNGLGNATMNFSSSSNSEQQQQQQRQHLAELYEQFENSENFELIENLEIIIPKYV